MKIVSWIFSQALWISGIYFGLYKGIPQAYWCLVAMMIVLVLGSFIYLNEDYQRNTLTKPENKRVIPKQIDNMYDALMFLSFVWFHAWWMAFFYVVAISFTETGISKAEKYMEE